ncbi:MAG: hypothetical protein L0229_07825 [Blastocatellia bacterium]|nr:hypothetical protein [Blastocatellia bacterium]
MEMEKSYYVVTCKPTYFELLREQREGALPTESDEAVSERMIVAITQGGFGQDVIDDERQVKERFLEHLFSSSGVDLPRSAEVFDRYFDLEETGEFIDLDEEF